MQNDLRNQLKSQTLDEVNPSAFKQVGGVVFPDATAARNLNDFMEIVNAYKAVHLPTNGTLPIPRSTTVEQVTLTDSKQDVTLLTAANDEVLEIISISARNASTNYETSGGALFINNNAVADLSALDKYTNTLGGVIYGYQMCESTENAHNPSPIILNGGDTLSLETTSTPNANLILKVMYVKRMQ